MKLDLSAAWYGAMKMLAANREMVLVLAGVFFFVPYLAFALFLPDPMGQAGASGAEPDMDAASAMIVAFYAEYWWALLLLALIQAVGSIALLAILGDRDRPTVGDAMGRGLRFLPPQIGAQILTGFAILAPPTIGIAIGAAIGSEGVAGLLGLLMVPVALYLLVKFSMSSRAIAIERIMNPITALGRSWRLTKGNSFRLFLFYLLLVAAFIVLSMIATLVFGLVFALGGEHVALIGQALISSLINVGFACVAYAVLASLHRRLSGPAATATVPTTRED